MSKVRKNRVQKPHSAVYKAIATLAVDCNYSYLEWNISFSITFSAAC